MQEKEQKSKEYCLGEAQTNKIMTFTKTSTTECESGKTYTNKDSTEYTVRLEVKKKRPRYRPRIK